MAAIRSEPEPQPPLSSSSASEIHVRVNSRRAIHPVDIPTPPPAAASPVVFREVKHFRSWVPWLVPTFVVANTVMFIITMYVNDCPKNSVSCIARFLGRFSFQPLKENPLLGPSSSALQKMGALEVRRVVDRHQVWLLVTCIWLHGGVFHLLANMLSLLVIGIRLEQEFGFGMYGKLLFPPLLHRAYIFWTSAFSNRTSHLINMAFGSSSVCNFNIVRIRRQFDGVNYFVYHCIHGISSFMLPGSVDLSDKLRSSVWLPLIRAFLAVRIGLLYMISGLGGSLLSALFLKSNISVGASGALFGLLGGMLSELIINWSIYTNKVAAFVTLLSIIVLNLAVGILPHVDNFAHIGGFLSGFFLGFVFLIRPQFGWISQRYAPPGYLTTSVISKFKKYQRVLWISSLIIFIVGFTAALVLLLRGFDANDHCSWCHYLSCVPTSRWSCNSNLGYCSSTQLGSQLNLTCLTNGKSSTYTLPDATSSKIQGLCSQLCS